MIFKMCTNFEILDWPFSGRYLVVFWSLSGCYLIVTCMLPGSLSARYITLGYGYDNDQTTTEVVLQVWPISDGFAYLIVNLSPGQHRQTHA